MDSQALFDQLQSHVLTLGAFDSCNTHEPKKKPDNGLNAALWLDYVGPAPRVSGLTSTTALLVFMLRLYSPMVQEPQDAIDPNILTAVDLVISALSGDFDLGSTVFAVDLLGMGGGPALSARAGYIEQDRSLYRVVTVTVPLLVDNAWLQHA